MQCWSVFNDAIKVQRGVVVLPIDLRIINKSNPLLRDVELQLIEECLLNLNDFISRLSFGNKQRAIASWIEVRNKLFHLFEALSKRTASGTE